MNKPDYTQSLLAANRKIKEREYWFNKLSGELIKTYFPTDHPKERSEQRVEKNNYRFPPACFSRLMEVSGGSDLKMHIILATGLIVLLHKYTGNNDITVGTPIYKPDVEEDFINTALVLRNFIRKDMTFRELLREMKQTTVEAIGNRNYPVEILAEQLKKNYSFDDDFPLFDVSILIQNIHDKEYLRRIKHNMSFSFIRTGEYIEGEVEYNALVYRKATVDGIIDHFIRLLDGVLCNLDLEISRIDILSPQEKKQVLFDFNDTKTQYPRHKTIFQLFAEQVEKTPHHMAVVEAVGGESVTYRELNEKAGRLSAYLRSRGIIPEQAAAVMAYPAIEMIAAILAILEAGGAYLPLNPYYPDQRKKYLLDDGNVKLLMTNYKNENDYGREIISLDDPRIVDTETHEPPVIESCAHNLAYIIYTSGSTGTPKGTMVEHRSVVRLVKNTNFIDFRETGRLLQTGALEFDASTFEIWGSLLNGWALYLAPKDQILNPETLKHIIKRYLITTLWMTSPLFNRMSDTDIRIFSGLKHLLVGGDVLSPVHINRVRTRYPQLRVINGYGPTENTTFSTTHLIDREYGENIPIGRPIANSTAYIVDRSDQPVPIGVPGELLVGGDGVSRGYMNNPELTAEKFNRSYRSYRSYIFYRTGDLARWLSNGTIEFFGRLDQQLKIRGFRIEPGEIENRILQYGGIKEAVVIAGEAAEKYLCAYITAEEAIDTAALKKELSSGLPDYMIPAYFVQMDRIPLTSNGKVDRKALPAPGNLTAGAPGIPPRNPVEEKLAETWKEILHIKQISIDADFFESGGNSLNASLYIARIHKEFDVNIPLKEVFILPTIRELSGYIKRAVKDKYISIEAAEEKEYYDLSPAQKRLYLVHQMEQEGTAYNMPLVMKVEGDIRLEKLQHVFIKLIQRHESLRTSFQMVGEQPVQRIHKEAAWSIEHGAWDRDSLHAPCPMPLASFVRPFDLSEAPLLRCGLTKIEKEAHILMVDMHHIISDGISQTLLVKEFMLLYTGQGEALEPVRVQYKDYALWQRKEKERLKKQEEFWLNEFKDEIPVLNLPIDYPRPVVQSFEGSTIGFAVDKEKTIGLEKLAAKENATLHMVLLGIINVMLSKLSGQEDIVIGIPTAGRRHADLEPVIGMFVNTLPLRNYP